MFPCGAGPIQLQKALTSLSQAGGQVVPGGWSSSRALSTPSAATGAISTAGFTWLLSMDCTAQAAGALPHFESGLC